MTDLADGSWEADVVTADGGTVHVRPIRPDDAPLIEAFHGRQSPESIYFRYFSPRPRLSAAEVRHFTTVDHVDREAFVALLDDTLVGVARYDRYRDRDEAEVAFFIDDGHHGRGLATILLEYLVARARTNGITRFVASVLPTNRKMLGVFRQAGFDTTSRFADGVIEVAFEVAETEQSAEAVQERAWRAEARSVGRLLEPRTVAVIGAGRRPGSIGHEVLRQLLQHEFAGPVYPVNREALHVASVRAWPSVLDVPDQVDLAVVAVPAEEVLDAVEECARARVGSLAVVSIGFREAGPAGIERERALVALARRHGIRLLGPASLGLVNTAPGVRLHATFAPLDTQPGRVALSLQSGSLGAAIVERATALGLGFSAVVAVGDKADVSGNDLLAWWADDERTDVVLLSLESFGNPRRFRRLAPVVARTKPVVALVRGGGADPDLLLGQTGVIGVDDTAELLDVARVLAWQPVPRGPRVVVVADTGGSAGFTAAACTAAGLQTRTEVLGLEAGPEAFGAAVRAALAAGEADAVLVVYATPLDPRPGEVAAAVAVAAAGAPGTTVVTSFPGQGLPGCLPAPDDRCLPNIEFPDAAARALGRAVEHGMWLARPAGEERPLAGLDLERVRTVVAGAVAARGAGALDDAELLALCRALGLRVAERRLVSSAAEAAQAAAAIGPPVALKAAGRDPSAKTEAAGVAVDLQTPAEVEAAYARMVSHLGDRARQAVVQAMVPPGTDVSVTLSPAPIVGSALGLGPGGALAGLLPPGARSVLPLRDATAGDLVERSGLAAVLDATAQGALVDAVLRLAELAEAVPEVTSFTCNPLIVSGDAAWVVDLDVRVAPVPVSPTEGLRRV